MMNFQKLDCQTTLRRKGPFALFSFVRLQKKIEERKDHVACWYTSLLSLEAYPFCHFRVPLCRSDCISLTVFVN